MKPGGVDENITTGSIDLLATGAGTSSRLISKEKQDIEHLVGRLAGWRNPHAQAD